MTTQLVETHIKKRIEQQRCPYCGVDRNDLYYENVEVDGKEACQRVDCMICKKSFTEFYKFHGIIIHGERREIE